MPPKDQLEVFEMLDAQHELYGYDIDIEEPGKLEDNCFITDWKGDTTSFRL